MYLNRVYQLFYHLIHSNCFPMIKFMNHYPVIIYIVIFQNLIPHFQANYLINSILIQIIIINHYYFKYYLVY